MNPQKTFGLLLIFVSVSHFLLTQNLENIPEMEKNNFILSQAKDAVMKHGPDYYRSHQLPIVEKKIATADKTEITVNEYENNIGKTYYTVTYPCNERDKRNGFQYPVKVYIWNDSGKVFKIMFGHGWGYTDLDSEITTRTNEPPLIMPYVDKENKPKDTVNIIIPEERRN